MKARSYHSRFLRKPVQPHVMALENVNEETIQQSVKLPLTIKGKKIEKYSDLNLSLLLQADNLGSLIQIAPEEVNAIQIQEGSIWQAQQKILKLQAEFLSLKYHCVVTNPPYMGARFMNGILKSWLQRKYPEGSGDLLAAFIIRCRMLTYENGLTGMITLHGWMFISTFSDLRKWLLDYCSFGSLVHIGGNSFPSMNSQIARAVSFIFTSKNKDYVCSTVCYDLDSVKNSHSVDKEELFNKKVSNKEIIIKEFSKFKEVQSYTFLYSVSDLLLEIFIKNQTIGEIAKPRQGLATGDNDRFVRLWHEVSFKAIGFNHSSLDEFNFSNSTYLPYNKGGKFRKWYGNNSFIIKFDKQSQDVLSNQGNHLPSRMFYFKEGLTYSLIGNTNFCARKYWEGHLFDVIGSAFFANSDVENLLLGLVNSSVGTYLLCNLNPTIAFQVGDICNIPIIIPMEDRKNEIENIVTNCIEIAKNETTFLEENFEHISNSLFGTNINAAILANLITNKITEIKKNIKRLYSYEIRLNSIFSELYNINFIDEEDNTISLNLYGLWKLKEENEIDQIIELKEYLIDNLLSYSICCMFGRYSLDKPGLILANQGETLQDYLKQIPTPSFLPDQDNIIPILDGEWFTDDIAGRFNVFLKVAFGAEHFEENIRFIEDTLGKDIRKYFVRDFYNDHIKRYKKRPIYWMFSSPKGHFKALIYMHRYQPDTCSRMLNEYLQTFIGKLESAKNTQTMFSLREDISGREKTLASKEIVRLEDMLKDCRKYEITLFTIATQKINIDLDDGVKVNYQKFKEVLIPIKGLEKE